MKLSHVFFIILITVISVISITCCSNQNRVQKETPQTHTFIIEEVDAEANLYRIDIISKDRYVEEPHIEYNIAVKFQNIILRETHKDSIINMILEELPEDPISITVQFNSKK
jgi:hypothetical protein